MKQFTDNAGRAWAVAINVDAIKRVKGSIGVDLLRAVEGKLIEELTDDPITLCNVLFVLCKEQAEKLGVSDEDFGKALGGDALEMATTALLDDLVDFFPKGKRQVLAKALAKVRAIQERAMKNISDRLDSPEFEQQMERVLESASS